MSLNPNATSFVPSFGSPTGSSPANDASPLADEDPDDDDIIDLLDTVRLKDQSELRLSPPEIPPDKDDTKRIELGVGVQNGTPTNASIWGDTVSSPKDAAPAAGFGGVTTAETSIWGDPVKSLTPLLKSQVPQQSDTPSLLPGAVMGNGWGAAAQNGGMFNQQDKFTGPMNQAKYKCLCRLFPHHDQGKLLQLYNSCGCDLLKAVNTLDPPKPPPPTDDWQREKQVVAPERECCKFWLQGYCKLTNCHFVHSSSILSSVCRFWLTTSYCNRGDQCMYYHTLEHVDCYSASKATPLAVSQKNTKASPAKVQKLPTKEDFVPLLRRAPAVPPVKIGAVKTPPPGFGPKPGHVKKMPTKKKQNPIIRKLKMQTLAERCGHVSLEIRGDVLDACDGDPEKAGVFLQEMFGPPPKDFKPSPEPSRGFSDGASPDRSSSKNGWNSPTEEVTWVETGGNVAKLYKHYRLEAEKHAKARNKLFMTATKAFLQNNKVRATDLSRQGQEHDCEMQRLHKLACEEIFNARNRQFRDKNVIDLHGLHVREALEALSQKLESRKQTWKNLDVITGVGKHARESRHRQLRPEVKNYLSSAGYNFTELKQAHGGAIRILLREKG